MFWTFIWTQTASLKKFFYLLQLFVFHKIILKALYYIHASLLINSQPSWPCSWGSWLCIYLSFSRIGWPGYEIYISLVNLFSFKITLFFPLWPELPWPERNSGCHIIKRNCLPVANICCKFCSVCLRSVSCSQSCPCLWFVQSFFQFSLTLFIYAQC